MFANKARNDAKLHLPLATKRHFRMESSFILLDHGESSRRLACNATILHNTLSEPLR